MNIQDRYQIQKGNRPYGKYMNRISQG